jgi:hypothetical protein
MSWTYNVNSGVASGGADGSMTIDGSETTLSQGAVNAAIASYNATPGQTAPLTSVVVAGTFTNVAVNGFYGTQFTSIVFSPNSQVTSLETQVFIYCTKLTNLVLPQKITEFPSHMCYGCSSLKTVVIPESVTRIYNYSFYECIELEHMVIPSNMTSIDNAVFAYCPKLVSIEFLNQNFRNVTNDIFMGTNNIRFMKLS